MPTPAGIEVARISVKVSPNTKQFRKDLKEDLERIEREIKGDVHVTAHLQTAQARADFERMKRIMQRNGRIKLTVDTVPGKDGVNGKNGKGGRGGRNGGIPNPGKLPKWLSFPNFGSGINPAGYAVIIAGLALVAAPLVGLVSALVLAIPGMISAVVTPMMAIGLGMDGIKKAAANSGLFKYDDKGELEGLGAVFDKVKAETSAAFDQGLTPSLKRLADSIDPLLGSLPQVATGMSDMFKGFVDSLTSTEGMGLFDDTIKNIGAAMSQAAPGVKSFTDGFLVLANSFTRQLPGLSTWLNNTGSSFSDWMMEMTKVPDPAGHHGPNPNGKSKMDLAFEGLGGTLQTIGDWAVDMAQAGLKFVSDPKSMEDFLGTLDSIGSAITSLVEMGNTLSGAWAFANGDDFANVPGVQNLPKPADRLDAVDRAREAAEAAAHSSGELPAPRGNFFKEVFGPIIDMIPEWLAPAGTRIVGDAVVKTNVSPGELSKVIRDQITDLNGRISDLEGNIKDRVDGGADASDPVLGNYKGRVNDLKDKLAVLQEMAGGLVPEVANMSFETPIGGSFVDQLVKGLEEVPPAAIVAKDALQTVKDTGIMTPEALGQLSENAQNPAVEAPVETQKIPAPDTSAFDAAMQELPAATTTAMQGVSDAVTTGGETSVGNLLLAGQQMVATLQTFTGLFQTAGQQMMMGLSNGITVGTAWVVAAARSAAAAAHAAAKEELEINSPSKKFIEIGLSTMEGMSKGMENGVGPVLDQAKDLANKVARAFADGSDPTEALKGMNVKEINRMEKLLGWDSKTLGRQIKANNALAKSTGDGSFKAEAERLKILKDEVDASREMLDLANEYNGNSSSGGGEDPFVKGASQLMNAPADFAKATGKQFMSDLGIGGNGLIGNAITEGISYIFNIASVDDALSVKDRQESVNAQSAIGR